MFFIFLFCSCPKLSKNIHMHVKLNTYECQSVHIDKSILSLFFFLTAGLSYLSPSLSSCIHFHLSSPATDRIEVRALWPVEQVTALTGCLISLLCLLSPPVCPSHFNNINMGQAQATENILCPGAQSLETHCTPELHMHIPKTGSTLQTKSGFFIF